ncbi:hypothetical protein A3F02_01345 [Candidatus Curtissbacteria bacterium RIFCSPHIGHO2_12_FULL_38_9b]|uniref:UDP-N-acetylglucosamine kinase n=2 Tax=Candidatus Curtissiibacteriota TaxID=1752717 RepID=A0A1F5GTX3_9BACT|nr:MAG: hypothetical protein A3F02_01345 [Candidatus Curtissbacteria bacterium RIFCSPHIGHO2_12_FULL_38_9b]OGD95937.1 MAG: hypothetical protein A3A48_03845 [Candidatus Curtissbacteria bacterium RIFCSPLOWO2_01_FULL_37_9]
MRQSLIILRGLPASGKSAIAKQLRNFNKKIVWLKVDNFKDFFGEGTEEQLIAANEAALSSLRDLLSRGYIVVMDGVFQDLSFVDQAVKIAKDVGIPAKVFELEISLDVAKKRDQDREGIKEGYREPIKDQVFNKIFKNVSSKVYPGAIKIDVETNSIEACSQIIRKHLND